MFTECHACGTTFRLSAEDLRRAQGRVRCGECGEVFNALESLAEDITAGDAGGGELPMPEPSWLTDSSSNPPGELEPDLDAYEAEGYSDPTDESEQAHAADLDEQDNGAAAAAPPDSTLDDEDDALEAALHALGDDEEDGPGAADADTTLAADDEPATVYEFDEDDDDASGIIVYLEPDEPDAAKEYAPLAGRSGLGALAEDGPSELDEHAPESALSDARPDAAGDESLDNSAYNIAEIIDPTDATPDFDESIWERIPGVGAELNAGDHDVQRDAADEGADSTNDLSAAELEDGSAGEDEDEGEDNYSGSAEYEAALSAEVNDDAPTESAATDDDEPAADAADGLEFDVPAEKWTTFFGPMPESGDKEGWQPSSLDAADSDDATDPDTNVEGAGALPDYVEDRPSWHGNVAATAEAERPAIRTGLMLIGGLLLALLFTLQLIHYNRDDLAAHPRYGAWVRDAYAALDQQLYPSWSLQKNYQIRASEAVAGESGQDVLDIRAQIAAVGSNPTGLPRLRVILRDRWSNPVAASDFSAADYARAADLPANGLLMPGTVIAAHVSILDPGSGAQGFELELCLPRRDTGLECMDQPFK